MTLYIDRPAWEWRGRLWSHLISDTSIEELHEFAREIHLRYLSFGIDHYDVPDVMLQAALAAGAELADSRELVQHLRHAGLRVRRGKEARTWRRIAHSDAPLGASEWSIVEEAFEAHRVSPEQLWILERPGTVVVSFETSEHPDAGASQRPAAMSVLSSSAGARPIRRVDTTVPGGMAIEVVVGDF